MSQGHGTKLRVLLADDHDMVRAGLRSVLTERYGLDVVAEAGDGHAAVRLARELSPDLVVMDISMPNLNGVEATRQIAALGSAKVIMLSMHGDEHSVAEALRAGALSYLLKSSAAKELGLAIEAVMQGRTYLSTKVAGLVVDSYVRRPPGGQGSPLDALSGRERDVLRCLAEGKTNKEIASELSISVKTVETHRAQLMDKLNIHTVAGLTKFAIRSGLSPLEGG
jgi:DNA-binding NarL/FixJ family response regulator